MSSINVEPTLAELIVRYNVARQLADKHDAEVFAPALARMWEMCDESMGKKIDAYALVAIARKKNTELMTYVDLCITAVETNQIRVLRSHDIPWIALSGKKNMYEDQNSYIARMNKLTLNEYTYDPRIRIGGINASDAAYWLMHTQKYHLTSYLSLAKMHYAWHEMSHTEKVVMSECLTSHPIASRRFLDESLHMYDDIDNYHKSGGSRYMADLDGIGKSVANLIAQYLWPSAKEEDIDALSPA